MIGGSHVASEVFDNLRALFGRTDLSKGPVDVNALAAITAGNSVSSAT